MHLLFCFVTALDKISCLRSTRSDFDRTDLEKCKILSKENILSISRILIILV